VFESADGLGGSVAGPGTVEVRQHVAGALLQCPSEPAQLGQGCGDAVADRLVQALHQRSASGSVRFAVGGDHALVDAPGRFIFDVVVAGEQRVQSLCLLVAEEVGAGVQGPPGGVEGVCGAAAVPTGVLLDPSAALVQRVAERTTWKGSITATASGSSSVVAVLNPVKPSIATTSSPSRQDCGRAASHCLKTCFERPSSMSSSRAGPVPLRIGGEIDDHGHVLVPAAGVPPHVLPRKRGDPQSTPIAVTPSKRPTSPIRTRLPSARTASLAVFHDTPRPSATRATLRC